MVSLFWIWYECDPVKQDFGLETLVVCGLESFLTVILYGDLGARMWDSYSLEALAEEN